MAVHSIIFGHDLGQPVRLFTLSNRNGMQVTITNFGAIITKIIVPRVNQEAIQVACGFDALADYVSQEYAALNPYFGATIGRYANRIAHGKFQLDGVDYNLKCNFHRHHLHGGHRGFDKQIWEVKAVDEKNNELKLSRKSVHLEEGYPGNLEVEVTFRLSDDNELSITFQAATDRPTVVSLTNHTYFNLSGFRSDIEDHTAKIESVQMLSMTDCLDQNGKTTSVHSAPLDLRQGVELKRVHDALGGGVDHYFVFEQGGRLQEVAEFHCPKNGLALKVQTDASGAQFYTAAHLSNKLKRNSEERYGPMMAFCFECHEFPNGPNLSPKLGRLDPGEVYQRQIKYQFFFKD